MPKEATYQGTNSQGNSYTNYSNGGYRYSNAPTSSGGTGGERGSSYYAPTGSSGGGFYTSNGGKSGGGYSTYTNPSGSTKTVSDYRSSK